MVDARGLEGERRHREDAVEHLIPRESTPKLASLQQQQDGTVDVLQGHHGRLGGDVRSTNALVQGRCESKSQGEIVVVVRATKKFQERQWKRTQ
jgi:hypothetical protein